MAETALAQPMKYLDKALGTLREATVNFPNVDLKWKNDSPYGVLIEASITSTVDVSFWSTKQYDEVQASKSARTNPRQPKTVYDPRPGCVAQGANPGFDVVVRRKVIKDGAVVKDQSWRTTYLAEDKVVCGPNPATSVPGPTPMAEWELPYGLRMPMGAYALAASRHMHQYGTTAEQLAQIAVDTRRWAAQNPRARLQELITVDDVLASPLEASPLHKLDCCLVTDGAGAIVMTSAERARSLRKPPAVVLGTGTCHTHAMISEMPDLTTTGAAVSGPLAFAQAGLTPADVDVVQLYDSFTITVLLLLEDLGFCPKGEGGAFVAESPLAPGGALPANTTGGGLAYTHPGMFGIFLLVEAVRQLRGECGPRQVPGAEVALAHGSGGVLSAMSTVILGTEATA